MDKRILISQKTQLSMHIISTHGIAVEQYVILTEYDGISPRCACGFCEESPNFYRGAFSEYAVGHDKFGYLEEAYIKKFGIPMCLNCGKPAKFYRGKPREYCSTGCSIKHQSIGFCDPDVQIIIRQNNFDKYGVENIAQVPEVAIKISKAMKGRSFPSKNPELTHARKSAASIKNWQNPGFRDKITNAIREAIINDPERLDAFVSGISVKNRLSKLHLKIRDYLELDALGFISEQQVLRYLVDDLCEDKKIIIEINGDYVHANPKKFASTDVIRMRGNSYTAAHKWESDALKIENLRQLGYTVFVIWESDDLDEKKKELYQLLGIQ